MWNNYHDIIFSIVCRVGDITSHSLRSSPTFLCFCLWFLQINYLLSKLLSIVQISTLKAIPSLGMVVHAISLLCKKRESVNYIKFPFGLLDYNRLKELQAYHEHKKIKQREKEDKKCGWLRVLTLAKVWELIQIWSTNIFRIMYVWSNNRHSCKTWLETRGGSTMVRLSSNEPPLWLPASMIVSDSAADLQTDY